METVSKLLVLCEGNPPVTGGFSSQRVSYAGIDVFFDVSLNKWLNKLSGRRWFETQGCSMWRHCNASHTHLKLKSRKISYDWAAELDVYGRTRFREIWAKDAFQTDTLMLQQAPASQYLLLFTCVSVNIPAQMLGM